MLLFFCRLDYCNSPWEPQSWSTNPRNSAARVLTRTRRRNHTITVLKWLHWLLVHFRYNFKVFISSYWFLKILTVILSLWPAFTIFILVDPVVFWQWPVMKCVYIKAETQPAFSHYGPYLLTSLPATLQSRLKILFYSGFYQIFSTFYFFQAVYCVFWVDFF